MGYGAGGVGQVCYVIDVGQAVDTGHSKAREYLARDLAVVGDFFSKKGVSGCLSTRNAEEFVVGYRGPSTLGVVVGMREALAVGLGLERPPDGVDVVLQVS